MSDYSTTRLWQTALDGTLNASHPLERERLRVAYRNFRSRASLVAQEISIDFSSLTVHDITHIDALWETADLILGTDGVLTPLEVFVIGCAFLVHDLGLSLAAYPNGIADLKQNPAWLDLLVTAFRRDLGRDPDETEADNPPQNIIELIKFEMIRNLHAEAAIGLLSQEWRDPSSGMQYRLLDDSELLVALGNLIGMLAHSHWWNAEELTVKFPAKLISPPVGFPRDWSLDPLKLALLLRLADIAHLDARRAPTFLKLLRRPTGLAERHWSFQEKLYQLHRDGDRLVYTGQPFQISDAQAWWLCFDTLQNVDEELRKADNINVNFHRTRFAAQGVLDSESPLRLRTLIPTEGWEPVDARVRVGSVASLVSRMGGQELYGDNQIVPLRELIQNGADAIRARRVLQNRPAEWGTVAIRTGTDEFGLWIEVQDDGVGMSAEVLTGHLLDFGNSFWKSKEASVQFPGLIAKGFKSTGQYGIGFFSLFMWGDRVRVSTRRYDAAVSDSRVLDFTEGLGMRPVLRPASQQERLSDGGTRVRVWPRGVDANKADWIRVLGGDEFGWRSQKMAPATAAYWLCPTLDVNLTISADSKDSKTIVEALDWLDLTGEQLLKRVLFSSLRNSSLAAWGNNVRPFFHKGQIIGRGCIIPSGFSNGCVTVGGFRSSTRLSIAAVIQGHSARVSREEADITIEDDEVARWATEQATLVRLATKDEEELAYSARSIAALGGEIGDLPIARVGDVWMNHTSLSEWARDKETVISVQPSDAQKVQQRSYGWPFMDNVLIEPRGIKDLIEVPIHRRFHSDFLGEMNQNQLRSVRRPLLKAIASGWSLPADDLEVWSSNGFEVTDDGTEVDAEEIKRPEVEE